MKHIILFIILLSGCATTTEHNDNRYGQTRKGPKDIEPHKLIGGNKTLYPSEYLDNGIEGIVVLEHDISKDGVAENIEIIYVEPKGYYEDVAIKTASTRRYKPATRYGEKMNTRGIRTYITFCLESENRSELKLRQKICEPNFSMESFMKPFNQNVSYDNL